MIKDKFMGKLCKDKITGFTGICVSKHSFITGCDQYGLQPPNNAETNVIPESRAFDDGRLEIIGPGITTEEVKKEKDPGGPERTIPCNTK